MPAQYDWGTDADGDLDVQNNDFTDVLSDEVHIEDTISAFPLWWKQFPADGVGIKAYLKSTGAEQKLMGSIKNQLQIDGYSCNNPAVFQNPDGTFTYNPNAIRL